MGNKKLTSLKMGFSGLKIWEPYVPNPRAATPFLLKKKKKEKPIINICINKYTKNKRIKRLEKEAETRYSSNLVPVIRIHFRNSHTLPSFFSFDF